MELEFNPPPPKLVLSKQGEFRELLSTEMFGPVAFPHFFSLHLQYFTVFQLLHLCVPLLLDLRGLHLLCKLGSSCVDLFYFAEVLG